MTQIKTKIPAELEPAAVGGMVTDSKYVIDRERNKTQTQINTETDERITTEVGRAQQAESTLDGKIAAEKTRAEGVEGGLNTRLQTVEQLATISVGGGDIGIGTAADFESDDPEDLAKVPTVGAMLGGANDGVYDISARHSGTKYADLAAALGTNGANVPVGVRKGGMSVKYVQTYDNKYVQYRLMSDSFNTTPANWQGVDDIPTAGSDNLVKSDGVRTLSDNVIQSIIDSPSYDSSKYVALSDSSYVYEDGKILKNDGTTATNQNYRVYTITHDSWSVYWRAMGIVGNFTGESNLTSEFCNIELKDGSGNLVFRGRLQGYKMIILQQNWELRISIPTTEATNILVQNASAVPHVVPPIFSSIESWPLKGSNNPVKGDGVFNYPKLIRQSIIDTPYIDKTKFTPLSEVTTDVSYEDNKLLRVDGGTASNNNYRIYTIVFTDGSPYNRSKGIYALFDGLSNLTDEYANIELKDNSNNIIYKERLSGEKLIIMQPNWVLRLCVAKTDVSKYFVQTTNGYQLENLNNTFGDIVKDIDKKIYGIGDSLTHDGTYLIVLNSLTGITTLNYGIGGENAATIFGRINSMPYKVSSDIVIPADNTEVEFSIESDYNNKVLPLIGSNSCEVQIAGIKGTLRTTANAWATTATYLFSRSASGSPVSVKAGEPIYCLSSGTGYQTKFGGIPSGQYQIIWVGQNGGFAAAGSTDKTAPSVITQDDCDFLVKMIKNHIELSKPKNFIVASPPQNTNATLEATFAKAFGGCYLNTRKQMMDNGIRIALENGYLVGDYPTQQDLEDISNGLIPSSLRNDAVHFNVAGYRVFATICYNNIIKNVWMLDV